MLQRLVYLSTATAIPDDAMLEQILSASRHHNKALEITGLLIVKGRTFLQALEGDSVSIRHLYDKIKQDARHRDIVMIAWEEVEERYFPDWSMGFKNLSHLNPAQHAQLIDFDKIQVDSQHFVENPSQIHELFQSLLALND